MTKSQKKEFCASRLTQGSSKRVQFWMFYADEIYL